MLEMQENLSLALRLNFKELDLKKITKCIDMISILCKQKASVELRQKASVLCKICLRQINQGDIDLNQILKLGCSCNYYCHKQCLRKLILDQQKQFESVEKMELIINSTLKCCSYCTKNLVKKEHINEVLTIKEINKYSFEYFEAQRQKEINEQIILEKEKKQEVVKFVCSICMDEQDLNQNGYILKCNCKFCIDCLKQCVLVPLQGNINFQLENIFCPNEHCKKVLDFEDITFIMKEEKQMIEKLEQKNIQSIFSKMKMENHETLEELITCPGKYKIQKETGKKIYIPKNEIESQRQEKGKINVLENEEIVDCNFTFIQDKSQKKQTHKCYNCKYEFCLNNCDTTHENFTCQQYIQWKIENSKDYRKELEAQGFKFCPNCQIITVKTEGCNRIICSKCKICYCYTCYFMAKTQDEVYSHLTKVHGGYY